MGHTKPISAPSNISIFTPLTTYKNQPTRPVMWQSSLPKSVQPYVAMWQNLKIQNIYLDLTNFFLSFVGRFYFKPLVG